jgi:ABC-type cobalamin/Fe3+-siderophores transport system ATPase subunit
MVRFPHLGMLGRPRRRDRKLVDDAMDRLDVADLRARRLDELSGGQRQRVIVAQGLAQEADVLLLDEPVTGLDLVSRQLIIDAIEAERAAGRTVVVTTHDLGDAATAQQMLLVAGRIVAAGPPDAVLTTANLEAAYGERVRRMADGAVLIDDPHHHAEGDDHTGHRH